MHHLRANLLLLAALGLGALIGLVDTSPGWDDTGITVMALAASCALFAALRPARPWRWALAIGAWVPLLNALRYHNYGALLALVFAFGAAYAGSLLRRALSRAGGVA